MKPVVCVPCKLFFHIKKNGVAIEEGMPRGDTWTSYKLWHGDLWECRGCGAQIIRGFPTQPIAEHFERNYADRVATFQPLFRVDDC